MKNHILPTLGSHRLEDMKRRDIVNLVTMLQGKISAATGRCLAPRTIHNVYGTLHALFADAVAEEAIAVSPCTLRVKRGELPKKVDSDPKWRGSALYTRDEVEQLISTPKIPEDRRVFYALLLLTGLRSGEAIGLRWRDYDQTVIPLGRLSITTQYENEALKTETPRDVPVHPALAKILEIWKVRGFALQFGRHPRPDDWIIPSRSNVYKHRSKNT